MALRISDEDNQKLNPGQNPGQVDADREFNALNLNKAETDGTINDVGGNADSSEKNDDIDNVDKAENAGTVGNWKDNTSKKEVLEDKQRRGLRRGRALIRMGKWKGPLKKKGPIASILLIVLGGGTIFSALFSPGLLIIHMKETMVNKFNVQLASMDVRTTKILKTKITTGLLCKPLNKCKYINMSDKQIAKFEKAGIKVTVKEGETDLLGKKVIRTLEFDGEPVNASNLASKMNENPEFRSAVRKAQNSKFAGFIDSIWEKIDAKFNISKEKAPIEGATDEERLTKVQEATKTDTNTERAVPAEVEEGQLTNEVDENGKPVLGEDGTAMKYTAETAAEANKIAAEGTEIANGIVDDAKVVADSGTKLGPAAAEAADIAVTTGKEVAENVGNFLKISGWLDNACNVYRAVQAVGYAAKAVRAVQLARYAMLFLNVADQIKAGNANPDDVSYLGKILTTEVAATLTTMKLRSATDSFGYKFAAYNERGQMSSITSQFLAGGGLPGQFIYVTDKINAILGNTPKTTCKFLGNTFVGAASGAVGIAAMLIPGGQIAVGAKDIAMGAVQIAFGAAMMFLPAMLKDIVAGVLVDKTTVGEAAGDAYTSGASGLMGSLAQRGGNAPLTPTQALAYNNLSNKVIAQYAEEDRLAYSPFDISNSNTFMGKIFAQLIPYASKLSSLPSILSSLVSIPTRSLAMVTSQNAMAIDQESNYTMCQDLDYNNLDGESGTIDNNRLATDPYCNVMYGIPVEALDTDPLEVVDALDGQLEEDGSIRVGSDYETFFNDCIARDRPLGDTGTDFQKDSGAKCLFTEENKNYYLYYIDQRVLSSMEDEKMTIDPGTAPDDGSTDPGSTDPGTIAPTEPELVDPGDIEPTTQTGEELIASIIEKNNVYYQYSPITEKNLEGVNESLLWVLNDLSNRYRFTIWSLKRDGDPSASQHNTGRAVDIVTVDGAPVTSGYDQSIQDFLSYAAERAKVYSRTGKCGIGTENSQYLSNMASQCTVFYDPGTGPHLHIDIRGG